MKPTVINVTYEDCQEMLDAILTRIGHTEEDIDTSDCYCCPPEGFKGTWDDWSDIEDWRSLRGPKRPNP